MTAKQIEKQMSEENRKVAIKYETAKKIRELLDAAAKEYGPEWGDDDIEARVLEIVTEDA